MVDDRDVLTVLLRYFELCVINWWNLTVRVFG